MKKPKISFFQNIYYWFWYYTPKIETKRGFSPPMFASGFVTISQIIGGGLAIMVFSALLKINFLETLLGHALDHRYTLIPVVFSIVLLLEKIGDSHYEGRHEIIVRYFKNLDYKTRLKKKIVFFIYLATIIILFYNISWLTSFYVTPKEPKQYAAPQGKVQTNEKGEVFILDNNGDTIPLKLKE